MEPGTSQRQGHRTILTGSRRYYLSIRKNRLSIFVCFVLFHYVLFYCAGCQTPGTHCLEILWNLHEDIQTSAGHGLALPALVHYALMKIPELDNLQIYFPTSSILSLNSLSYI